MRFLLFELKFYPTKERLNANPLFLKQFEKAKGVVKKSRIIVDLILLFNGHLQNRRFKSLTNCSKIHKQKSGTPGGPIFE